MFSFLCIAHISIMLAQKIIFKNNFFCCIYVSILNIILNLFTQTPIRDCIKCVKGPIQLRFFIFIFIYIFVTIFIFIFIFIALIFIFIFIALIFIFIFIDLILRAYFIIISIKDLDSVKDIFFIQF